MVLTGVRVLKNQILGREITTCVQCLDHGIQVVVTGGDLSHIGAVSVVDEQGLLSTNLLPGHRDDVISEKWAQKIYEAFLVPVVVTAGIHYDHISGEEIRQVVLGTDSILAEVLDGIGDGKN
jgi:hypothetical protein